MQEVTGSSPVPSTTIPRPFGLGIFLWWTVQGSNRAALTTPVGRVSNQPSGLLLSPRFPAARNVYRDDYRLVVDGTGLQRPYLLGNRSPCIHRHSDFRPDGKLIPRIKKRQVSPKSRDLSLLYFCTLQRRIAEAVHQRVDVLAGLAHGAVAAVEAGVIRQAGGVEDGRDLVAQTFMGGGKDG